MKNKSDDDMKCKKCGHAKKSHTPPDGSEDPRPLSIKQRAALVRMLDTYWEPPRGDGRIQHGFRQTLWSLQKRGLVEIQKYGWLPTDSGRKEALAQKEKNNPQVMKEARR